LPPIGHTSLFVIFFVTLIGIIGSAGNNGLEYASAVNNDTTYEACKNLENYMNSFGAQQDLNCGEIPPLFQDPCPPNDQGGLLPSAFSPCGPPTPTCSKGQMAQGTNCVPKSCSTGKRNNDGSCVPAACPAPQPNLVYNNNVANNDANDPHFNPEMKFHIENALKSARDAGLNPVLGEGYRTPERSADLVNRGVKAGGPWGSGHNYGLAVDIWLYDNNGNQITETTKGWYSEFKKLATHMKNEGFTWWDDHLTPTEKANKEGDANHFAYHPNWSGNAHGGFLKIQRDNAMQEAAKKGNYQLPADPKSVDWLREMWKKAGAACSP